MTGIAGIFCLDGRTVDAKELDQMAETIRPRGPDGIKIWKEGAVGLVHSHFYTTPEDLGEEQPISDLEKRQWIAADARIDNRDELISMLGGALNKKVPTDAELILAAYKKWNYDCPRYIIGDFAFAIWDEDRHEMFLARDPAGVRQLNYCRTDESLLFASSLEGLIAALDDLPEINRPFIEDLLAGRFGRWVHETAYRDIFRLPPCYQLTASQKGVALKRYWIFGAGPEIRFGTEEEYLARFKELFREAVSSRLRSIGPIAITAGGGVDASAIACLVNDLIAAGEHADQCRIVSCTYDNTPQADERDYIDILLKGCPHLQSTLVPSDDLWALAEFDGARDYPLYEPEIGVLRAHILALLSSISSQGCRVLLSGHFADQLLNRNAYYLPQLIMDLSLGQISEEWPHFRMKCNPMRVARELVFPFIPIPLKKILGKCISRSPGFLMDQVEKKSADLLRPPTLRSRSSGNIYNSLMDGSSAAVYVQVDNVAAYTGLEWRMPYLDRRLIEFVLSLPPQMTFRGGFSKFILRKSMSKIPQEIRWRNSRTHLGEVEDRGLMDKEKNKIIKLIEGSLLAEKGFVSQPDLDAAWNLYWHASYPIQPLRGFVCAESWLRYYEKIKKETLNSRILLKDN